MTAEIAIMNKNGVALAADSAVTIETSSGVKIYNTAHKLFMLSKYHPVGIMIYGNASFMGIPWETIIKIYRNILGTGCFNHLAEYAEHFINFLSMEHEMFPSAQQDEYFTQTILQYYLTIRKDIEDEVDKVIAAGSSVDETIVRQILNDVIDRHYELWKNTAMLPAYCDEDVNSIISNHLAQINETKGNVFGDLPISRSTLNKLKKISAWLFVKSRFRNDNSGIVIAGFGESEFFPVLTSYKLECLVDNKLKYEQHIKQGINFENSASIIPFAQSEMVATFMEGINPEYKQVIMTWLNKFLEELPDQIGELLNRENPGLKQLYAKLRKSSKNIFSLVRKKFAEYETDTFVDKVVTAVSVLPKDELAAMAESLVNLTSLKRRVSTDSETVGGPIDVAIISKGDGFIWIKRKHYFKPECNPHFFSKYYVNLSEECACDEK